MAIVTTPWLDNFNAESYVSIGNTVWVNDEDAALADGNFATNDGAIGATNILLGYFNLGSSLPGAKQLLGIDFRIRAKSTAGVGVWTTTNIGFMPNYIGTVSYFAGTDEISFSNITSSSISTITNGDTFTKSQTNPDTSGGTLFTDGSSPFFGTPGIVLLRTGTFVLGGMYNNGGSSDILSIDNMQISLTYEKSSSGMMIFM